MQANTPIPKFITVDSLDAKEKVSKFDKISVAGIWLKTSPYKSPLVLHKFRFKARRIE
jgi:hypothetical protein